MKSQIIVAAAVAALSVAPMFASAVSLAIVSSNSMCSDLPLPLRRITSMQMLTVMSRLFHARLKVQKILNEYLELDESKQGVGSE